MTNEASSQLKALSLEQTKAGQLLGGELDQQLEETAQKTEWLSSRHAENLSLYSAQEELTGLHDIAKKFDFPVAIVPIGEGEKNLGYMVVAKYGHIEPARHTRRRPILRDAAIDFVDFDDTQAQTSTQKYVSWAELEKLGIPREIVKYCDKIARLSFQEGQGEIYEPELDMRLLSYALEHKQLDIDHLKPALDEYLRAILMSTKSAPETFDSLLVSEKIREIFNATRFQVELYPDTREVLTSLQGPYDEGASNVFVLTFGDTLFQLEKTISLLKDGTVPAIFLTKAKKGPFIQQLFKQNVFDSSKIMANWPVVKDLNFFNLSRSFDSKSQYPIALTDDDPSQVASVDELSEKLGFMMEARRLVSPDQKRAGEATPVGKRVVQIHRDENLRIREDMKKIQAELFSQAIRAFLVRRFKDWARDYHILNIMHRESEDYPYIDKFLKGSYGEKMLLAARYQMQADGSHDEAEAFKKIREEFEPIATEIVNTLLTT